MGLVVPTISMVLMNGVCYDRYAMLCMMRVPNRSMNGLERLYSYTNDSALTHSPVGLQGILNVPDSSRAASHGRNSSRLIVKLMISG